MPLPEQQDWLLAARRSHLATCFLSAVSHSWTPVLRKWSFLITLLGKSLLWYLLKADGEKGGEGHGTMSDLWTPWQAKLAQATTGTVQRTAHRSCDTLSCHVEEVHWYCVTCPKEQGVIDSPA